MPLCDGRVASVVAGADVFARLAELACAIADAAGLESVCNALESGRLSRDSTAATRAAIAEGNASVENHLRSLQEAWSDAGPELLGPALALVLRTSAASVAAFRTQAPSTEVVWTGPRVEGSYLRATREVIRELLRGAHAELLVVGYWIAARDDRAGIIEEVIASLAEAVSRGIVVRIVIDERVRSDGRDNRRILISAWPVRVALPKILTWHLPPSDQHVKLHAKLLVADRRDALVTSANLTSYAMDRNIEMGVRVLGHPAAAIARHFDLLEAYGILNPYDAEEQRK
jgi:phosphatidylserine/phosphatidylglycerophosphate/cardiolipin synthase-like enzyme